MAETKIKPRDGDPINFFAPSRLRKDFDAAVKAQTSDRSATLRELMRLFIAGEIAWTGDGRYMEVKAKK